MRKFAVLLTVAFVWSSVAIAVRAEESSKKGNGELAEALEGVEVSLDDGLRASEAQGTPILESLRSRMESSSSPSIR